MDFKEFVKFVREILINTLKKDGRVMPQLLAQDAKGRFTMAILLMPPSLWREAVTAILLS